MEYISGHPWFWLLQAAFTVWMLYDAYRRPADQIWLWIIFMAQPIGAWAYFFVVKWGDFGFAGLLGPRRPSLDELHYRAEQTPTLATRLELAEGLVERGRHAEAIPYLEMALKQEPEHCRLLYLLALCRTEQGHPDQALPLLERVLARDRAWSDYAAWRLLVATRAQHGDSAGALAGSRDLARLSPTLQHRCLLAERLLADGLNDEARDVLDVALEEHRYAPRFLRRRDRRWASHARTLQKRVPVTSGTK